MVNKQVIPAALAQQKTRAEVVVSPLTAQEPAAVRVVAVATAILERLLLVRRGVPAGKET